MIKKFILPFICLFQFFAIGQNKISSYQYWVNSDFGNQTTVSITPEVNFHLQTDLDISGLEKGFHTFNIRFQDENLKFSSVLTQLIYAKANSDKILAYEYWFDTDYTNKVNVPINPQMQLNLLSSFDCSALVNGTHILNIRFLDEGAKWSSVASQFFQKSSNGTSALNKITAYRYWIDSSYTEMNYINLATAQNPFHLTENVDFTQIPAGQHLFNIQFKDTAGYWSSVLTDTVVKNALPIANFNYSTTANCDSTVVNLENLSFDGNTYAWDFGNSTFSSDSLPFLTYYSPGTYNISLTVTDSNSGLDSTLTKSIVVLGPSSNTISMNECFEAVSPSGLYVWSQSGQYLDTILNQSGCDSLLTINLTINTVDVSTNNTDNVLSATPNASSYQWIDCGNGNQAINGATNQSFIPTVNGSYAVIVNDGTCSDTSACLLVDNLRIDEMLSFYGINVFPNPSKDFLNITFAKANSLSKLSIKDLTGRILISETLENATSVQFDIVQFSDGIYVLEIELEGKSSQIKFVKE